MVSRKAFSPFQNLHSAMKTFLPSFRISVAAQEHKRLDPTTSAVLGPHSLRIKSCLGPHCVRTGPYSFRKTKFNLFEPDE